MIEIISQTRCIGCNQCVAVCPTNVFDKREGGIPVIARQQDCQTCFMCELYCPVDALFVAIDPDRHVPVQEDVLEREGMFGLYRETVGWGRGRNPIAGSQHIYELNKLSRGE